MQNWKEVNVWSSTVYSCDFHEGRQHFITLLMFVLNFVLFFNLFTVDNHIVDACVEFCFLKKQYLTINMQLLLPARASEQGNVIGLVSVYIYIYICHQKKIVIERTRDLNYLKFVATDFSPKTISPSAGENSGDLA